MDQDDIARINALLDTIESFPGDGGVIERAAGEIRELVNLYSTAAEVPHSIRVDRVSPSAAFIATGPTYQAICSCGWLGGVRNSRGAADHDVLTHKR